MCAVGFRFQVRTRLDVDRLFTCTVPTVEIRQLPMDEGVNRSIIDHLRQCVNEATRAVDLKDFDHYHPAFEGADVDWFSLSPFGHFQLGCRLANQLRAHALRCRSLASMADASCYSFYWCKTNVLNQRNISDEHDARARLQCT